MAQVTIFAEQTLEGFDTGVLEYVLQSPCELVLGQTYTVVIDGTATECECVVDEAITGSGLPCVTDVVVNDSGGFEGRFFIGYGSPEVVGATEYGALVIYVNDTTSTEHTVAIYQVAEGDETETYNANDAIILSYSQNPDLYENIPKVWLTHPTSTEDEPVLVPFTFGEAVSKTVEELDFTGGDMPVEIAAGELVTELTLVKPADLAAENIRYGKEIAGVTGTFLGDIEDVTVALNMATGDQEITPSAEGKAMSRVTVKKPDTLIPENIVKDVEIGGIIGTHEGEGEAVTVELDMADGDQVVTPIDGKLLRSVTISKPDTLVPENIVEGVDIGGVVGTFEGGDGNADKTVQYIVFTNIASATARSTYYAANTSATITVSTQIPNDADLWSTYGSFSYITNGTSLSNTLYNPAFAEPTDTSYTKTVGTEYTTLKMSRVLPSTTKAQYKSYSMLFFAIYTVPGIFLETKNDITTLIFDSSVSYFGGKIPTTHTFSVADLSDSGITGIADYMFQYAKMQRVLLPNTVTSIGTYAFQNCTLLTEIVLPNTVTSIGTYAFQNCTRLPEILLPDTVTSIGTYAFGFCTSLTRVVIPEGVTSIETWTFYGCTSLTEVVILGGLTSIGATSFYGCTSLALLDCSACTQVPTLGNVNAFTNATSNLVIKVPSDLYDAWIAATNWSTYATYIVAV